MATVYELKTMSHGDQIGHSKFFDTREEAEREREMEKAADKAYKKLCLTESGFYPGFSFRYYIKKHENAILWGIHPKKSA